MNKLKQLHLDVIESKTFIDTKKNPLIENTEIEDFQFINGIQKAASKSAEITEQIAIEFGNFLFSKGIEYYDDLSNGANYTIENEQGTFTMKELFQEFLKQRQ